MKGRRQGYKTTYISMYGSHYAHKISNMIALLILIALCGPLSAPLACPLHRHMADLDMEGAPGISHAIEQDRYMYPAEGSADFDRFLAAEDGAGGDPLFRYTYEEELFCAMMYANQMKADDIVDAILKGELPSLGKPEQYAKLETMHSKLIAGLSSEGSCYRKFLAEKAKGNFLNASRKRRRVEEGNPGDETQDEGSPGLVLQKRSRDRLSRNCRA